MHPPFLPPCKSAWRWNEKKRGRTTFLLSPYLKNVVPELLQFI